MSQVGAFDMDSGTPGNCAEFLRAGLAVATRQTLKAFPESFGHHAGHGFACLLSDGRREPMRFGVFDIEGFHGRRFCKTSKILPFYHSLARARPRVASGWRLLRYVRFCAASCNVARSMGRPAGYLPEARSGDPA